LAGHEGKISGMAFSPTGDVIVTTGEDKTIKFWDAKTGKKKEALGRHYETINNTALSPDGRYVVTASQDGMAWLWETKSDKKFRELRDPRGFLVEYGRTTGEDYANDVLARAQYYAELWNGGVAPSVARTAVTDLGTAGRYTPAPSLEDVQAQKEALKLGHEGAAVSRVQELLGGVEVDGKFGEDTRQAVMAFQRAHTIKPSAGLEGAVDKVTLEILGTVHTARPVRRGDIIYGRHTVSDQKVKELLQKIADSTGTKVILTSGDRKRVVNNNSRSHHLVGRAADFRVEGLTLGEAYRLLKDTVIPKRDYQFIYHTEVTTAPHLHIGRYDDNRLSTFIVDTGQILPRRR
jgi:peptidoglycan hydrolase-like protein with peptidoglycan-binding domain